MFTRQVHLSEEAGCCLRLLLHVTRVLLRVLLRDAPLEFISGRRSGSVLQSTTVCHDL